MEMVDQLASNSTGELALNPLRELRETGKL